MTSQWIRFAIEEYLGPDVYIAPTYGNTLMGLAASDMPTAEDDYKIAYYAPQPRAVVEVVDFEDYDKVVPYGETGRVHADDADEGVLRAAVRSSATRASASAPARSTRGTASAACGRSTSSRRPRPSACTRTIATSHGSKQRSRRAHGGSAATSIATCANLWRTTRDPHPRPALGRAVQEPGDRQGRPLRHRRGAGRGQPGQRRRWSSATCATPSAPATCCARSPSRDLLQMVKKAGELYAKAELPLGDGTQTPDQFVAHAVGDHRPARAHVQVQHGEEPLRARATWTRSSTRLTRGLDLNILSRGYGIEARGVPVSYQAQSPVLGMVLPSQLARRPHALAADHPDAGRPGAQARPAGAVDAVPHGQRVRRRPACPKQAIVDLPRPRRRRRGGARTAARAA